MTIAEKLADALRMFWQALDEEERRVVLYLTAYFACSVAVAMHRRQRARMVAELREEIGRGAPA